MVKQSFLEKAPLEVTPSPCMAMYAVGIFTLILHVQLKSMEAQQIWYADDWSAGDKLSRTYMQMVGQDNSWPDLVKIYMAILINQLSM